ncbi:MAG TPA: hypothetical protein VFT55_06490 [Planctomycetota bacterium]|nr:hypothetical protein [Planctomycetota bacterium]
MMALARQQADRDVAHQVQLDDVAICAHVPARPRVAFLHGRTLAPDARECAAPLHELLRQRVSPRRGGQ